MMVLMLGGCFLLHLPFCIDHFTSFFLSMSDFCRTFANKLYNVTQISDIFYNGLHGLYGFFVARGDDGRMQNNPNGRSRRGSKIRIIRAIRCGKNTSER